MLLFSLTLGVYCSSWTFYGATGAAVREGIIFLPIYLGPLIFVGVGYDIWRRLGRVRQHHAISSIADFVAARYGKKRDIGLPGHHSCRHRDYSLFGLAAQSDCLKCCGDSATGLWHRKHHQWRAVLDWGIGHFGHDFLAPGKLPIPNNMAV